MVELCISLFWTKNVYDESVVFTKVFKKKKFFIDLSFLLIYVNIFK